MGGLKRRSPNRRAVRSYRSGEKKGDTAEGNPVLPPEACLKVLSAFRDKLTKIRQQETDKKPEVLKRIRKLAIASLQGQGKTVTGASPADLFAHRNDAVLFYNNYFDEILEEAKAVGLLTEFKNQVK